MVRGRDSLVAGALMGALAGLAASYAMEKFQQALSSLGDQPGGGDDPSTVKVAEMVVGHPIPKDDKPSAGATVHYVFGTLLGALYGAAVPLAPAVASCFGMVYGAAVALVFDEGVLPLIGISEPPWETTPALHAYSLSSHLVYGAALEAIRRILRRVLP